MLQDNDVNIQDNRFFNSIHELKKIVGTPLTREVLAELENIYGSIFKSSSEQSAKKMSRKSLDILK